MEADRKSRESPQGGLVSQDGRGCKYSCLPLNCFMRIMLGYIHVLV